MTLGSRVPGFVAAFLAFAVLAVGIAALGAGPADAKAGSYSCNFRSLKVTQSGNTVAAKGRLKCTGTGVKRQVLRVCLLQEAGSNYRTVKCVVRTRNGPGLFTATASRKCGTGIPTGFVTRTRIRVRLDGGSIQTAKSESSDTQLPRNCA